jgi:hypothetical protein
MRGRIRMIRMMRMRMVIEGVDLRGFGERGAYILILLYPVYISCSGYLRLREA